MSAIELLNEMVAEEVCPGLTVTFEGKRVTLEADGKETTDRAMLSLKLFRPPRSMRETSRCPTSTRAMSESEVILKSRTIIFTIVAREPNITPELVTLTSYAPATVPMGTLMVRAVLLLVLAAICNVGLSGEAIGPPGVVIVVRSVTPTKPVLSTMIREVLELPG